jgi:hypothetical protein
MISAVTAACLTNIVLTVSQPKSSKNRMSCTIEPFSHGPRRRLLIAVIIW